MQTGNSGQRIRATRCSHNTIVNIIEKGNMPPKGGGGRFSSVSVVSCVVSFYLWVVFFRCIFVGLRGLRIRMKEECSTNTTSEVYRRDALEKRIAINTEESNG